MLLIKFRLLRCGHIVTLPRYCVGDAYMDFFSISLPSAIGAYKEFIIPALSIVGYIALRLAWRQSKIAWNFFNSRQRALSAVAREKTSDGPREGKGLWLSMPPSPPENYRDNFQTKVIAFANNKGGVGKTTLTANLAAHWARDWDKRVLLVDLDYQGTLSAMALRKVEHWVPKGHDSLASRAISGDLEPNLLVNFAKEVPNGYGLRIIPAYYDLAQAENRLIVEWLLQAPRQRQNLRHFVSDLLLGKSLRLQDIRYNLAAVLQSRAVREAFDVVLIDCPPRLTTGTIQALCASTHLVVPTILDMPSAEAVVTFCEEVQTLKTADICPNLKYAGIVGVRVSPNVNGIAEVNAMNLISDRLADLKFPSGFLDKANFIRDAAPLVNDVGEGIAYLVMGRAARQQQIRDVVGNLAKEIASKIGMPPPSVNFQHANDDARVA